MRKIVLASGSPRRRELLRGLDLPFEVRLKKDIKECQKTSRRHAACLVNSVDALTG